jgi:hypothetical protein
MIDSKRTIANNRDAKPTTQAKDSTENTKSEVYPNFLSFEADVAEESVGELKYNIISRFKSKNRILYIRHFVKTWNLLHCGEIEFSTKPVEKAFITRVGCFVSQKWQK